MSCCVIGKKFIRMLACGSVWEIVQSWKTALARSPFQHGTHSYCLTGISGKLSLSFLERKLVYLLPILRKWTGTNAVWTSRECKLTTKRRGSHADASQHQNTGPMNFPPQTPMSHAKFSVCKQKQKNPVYTAFPFKSCAMLISQQEIFDVNNFISIIKELCSR